MESSPYLADQIAAERGCNLSTAKRFVMIDSFYRAGRDREYIAQALRLKPQTIRKYEKQFEMAVAK